MKSTAKAEATIRDLKSELTQRIQGAQFADLNTIREAKDAQGWPMLVLSKDADEAAGSPVVAIRMKAVDAVSKDIFGNSLTAFAPHTIEVAAEDAAVVRQDQAIVDSVVGKLNIKTLIKTIAAGTAVTEAAIDAAAPVAVIDWLQFPTKLG